MSPLQNNKVDHTDNQKEKKKKKKPSAVGLASVLYPDRLSQP